MTLDYGKDFTILRVVGLFISSLLLYRVYELVSTYYPGGMHFIGIADVVTLLISGLIVLYCFTMNWQVELKSDCIITRYGFLLSRRQHTFNHIEKVQFKCEFIQVNNGPSRAYISVLVQPGGRQKPYPVCALHQQQKSLFQGHYRRKHQTEIIRFNHDVDRLLALYPEVAVVIDDKVEGFYQSVVAAEFPWSGSPYKTTSLNQ